MTIPTGSFTSGLGQLTRDVTAFDRRHKDIHERYVLVGWQLVGKPIDAMYARGEVTIKIHGKDLEDFALSMSTSEAMRLGNQLISLAAEIDPAAAQLKGKA